MLMYICMCMYMCVSVSLYVSKCEYAFGFRIYLSFCLLDKRYQLS
jgi:hypothetical protein